MLTLTVLGSGTSIPSHRNPPAHLVQADGTALLLDCGGCCTTGLYCAGVTLDRLDGILLTHLHPDHTAGLLPVLFALVNPMHPPRDAPLVVRGPAGTRAHVAALEEAHGKHVRPACGVEVHELSDGDSVVLGGVSCTAVAVAHSGPSLAYRLERGGAVLCYSGDSEPCDGLRRAARGADLLLCECAALQGEELEGHMTDAQVGELATAVGCRRVVLTHLYPQVERGDPVAGVLRRFHGPVSVARDGEWFQVGGEAE